MTAPALKDFQQTGARFLAERTRALLADEPGVGKTAQLIKAAQLVGARRVLVVCPDIGVEHWLREGSKWGLTRPEHDVQVISWRQADALRAQLSDRGGPRKLSMQWDALIPDESHFGKSPQAKRTRAVFGTGGLGWYARRIWAASGTPAPNNMAELWPLLRAFGKTGLSYDGFVAHFCKVNWEGKVVGNNPDTLEELRAILKSFALRRKKKDVLPELGEIDVQEWYVKPARDFLTGRSLNDAAHEDAQLHAELRGKSDDELLAFLAGHEHEFATLRRYNALLKAPAVFDTVKFEIENELLDKVVIYGYHVEAMQALDAAFRLAKIKSALITGDTPPAARDGIIEDWKKSGQVLIASSIIASTVLDFTAAHQGIMLEMDWVPGNNAQAMQRMHRQGQENPVTVRVALGTPIDEIVSGVLMRKAKALNEIFG